MVACAGAAGSEPEVADTGARAETWGAAADTGVRGATAWAIFAPVSAGPVKPGEDRGADGTYCGGTYCGAAY